MGRRSTQGKTGFDRTVPFPGCGDPFHFYQLPGETEEDFAELLAFRPMLPDGGVSITGGGTAAARLPEQVHPATKKRRARLVLEQQQEHSAANNQALIGRELLVLLEKEKAPGQWEARSYREAPPIDGVVNVRVSADQKAQLVPGAFVPVVIEAAGPYELDGKIKTNC